jgi:hypothetical protein
MHIFIYIFSDHLFHNDLKKILNFRAYQNEENWFQFQFTNR